MSQQTDQTHSIRHSIVEALDTLSPLQIVGGGSKSFYGRALQGKVLVINKHQGIINYHPSELVITARTGTLLSEIESTLAEQGQMLAFEPPSFSPLATLGGTIACGFSGARRPYSGSARDFVLGCKIINGKAEILSFGGEVMKNVAGYDVSRLMVGAMGTLGVLLEVSLKVLPKPAVDITCLFELKTSDALSMMSQLSRQPIPLSGLTYDGEHLYVRLSGAKKSIAHTSQKLGGEKLVATDPFWHHCNEQQHRFFDSSINLWRISVPPATPELNIAGEWFYEWGGAQRWLKTSVQNQDVFGFAEKVSGHATLFRGHDRRGNVFQPMSKTLQRLNSNINKTFDPHNIFNPFRMYKDY